jgi:preprotein translocase subunit SecE
MIKAALLTVAVILIGTVAAMLVLFWLVDWCCNVGEDE